MTGGATQPLIERGFSKGLPPGVTGTGPSFGVPSLVPPYRPNTAHTASSSMMAAFCTTRLVTEPS